MTTLAPIRPEEPAAAVVAAAPRPWWRRGAARARQVYGVLVLAGAALWLAYALLRRAVSGHWHWSLLLDAVPPVALLGLPGLVLLAAAGAAGRVRRWAALLALAGVALGVDQSGLNWHALRPGDRPVPAGALHVVSWNTQYWDQWDDTEALYAYLKRQNADVYLLQEHVIWIPGTGEAGYHPLADDDRLRREFPDHHIARRGELLTLSRYPIVAQPPVGPDVALAADPGTPFKRVFDRAKVLRTDLRVGDRVLSAYNVHITVQTAVDLSFFSDFDFDRYYRRKFDWRQEEIRGLEADVAANPHPALISGDFNSTSAMGNMDRLRDLTDDATRASRDLLPLTWKFDSPTGFDWDSVLDRPLPFWRVDWTLTRGPVEVHRYDLRSAERLSDHRLQEVWVSLR
ncbi:endonuclease/exonuclease/phosphatase family protein [Micromonospora sp. NPDC126480]|uniref:endonuclease/exonuclease/phosphatase family protein n=1 Tax=Micromonospora sp. NPDC126480 TaxID=3155312 RepID=UPI003316B029